MKRYCHASLGLVITLLIWSPAEAQVQPRQPTVRACSSDALPAAERRRLQSEYTARLLRDGRRSADAWSAEQGRRFRARLEAEGVCKPQTSTAKTARDKSNARPKGKNGKPCTRTRVENRVSPGFGGAPMTMGMVVVCDD